MRSPVRSLRTLLVAPTAFFDERPPAETLPIAIGLVVVYAVCLVGALVLLGSILAGSIDATVTVDNPDRPPEPICDQHGDDPDSVFGQNCDEPETIERDAGALLQETMQEYLWVALVGPFMLWLLGTGVLYVAGRLAGGMPSFAGTMALAGWAALPEFLRLGIALLVFHVAFSDVTITDPESETDVLLETIASQEPLLLAVSLVTIVWQWLLLTGGLTNDADIPWESAAIAVGVSLGTFFVLSAL